MSDPHVEQVRRFNRIVTQRVGALEESYLQRGRSLGQARLLHEVPSEGIDVRILRERLKLDSGYLSRLLRSLESQGLVATRAHAADGRIRRVMLTPKGRAERARYDALSDDLAMSFLKPLDPSQGARLVNAMAEVERLLRAGAVELRLEAPTGAAAKWCLSQYFAELSERFETRFDPAVSNPAGPDELTPPAGFFFVAWLEGGPAGCGALKVRDGATGEIKRMWTAPGARGLGIARRMLRALEETARQAGLTRLQLETNRTLSEAQALYRKEGYEEVAPFNAEPYAHHWFEKRL